MMYPLVNRRRFLRTIGAGGVAGIGLAGTAVAGREKWTVELEAVEGVRGNPHGGGMFERDGTTMHFALDARGLTSDVFAAHIHHETPTGPPLVGLYPEHATDASHRGSTFDARGRFNGSDTDLNTLDALVSEFEAGNAFVRAHTDENPGGEVFGLIR